MNLGLFGGSFDPVHIGHIELARACRDRVPLDRVCFIPTAQQPLKQIGPHASAADRCAMLELALADHRHMMISRMEIDRSGISYTIDTVKKMAAMRPHDALYLLLGADTVCDLPAWRAGEAIFRMATPIFVARSGEPAIDWEHLAELVPDKDLERIRRLSVPIPPPAISSRQIRHRVSAGQSIAELVPPAVAEYITSHRLYR